MNDVNLIGRLTRDMEIRYSAGADPVAVGTFTLAVDRWKGKGEKETAFIRCKAFGRQAESMSEGLHKGSQVGITGHISTGSYEKDGRKIYTTDVVVDKVTYADGGKKEKDDDIPEGFREYKDDDGIGDIPF